MKVYTANEMKSRRQMSKLIDWLEAEGFDPHLVWSVAPMGPMVVRVRRFATNEWGRPKVLGGQPVFADDVIHEATHRFPLPLV